jgi:hypothetical protein
MVMTNQKPLPVAGALWAEQMGPSSISFPSLDDSSATRSPDATDEDALIQGELEFSETQSALFRRRDDDQNSQLSGDLEDDDAIIQSELARAPTPSSFVQAPDDT